MSRENLVSKLLYWLGETSVFIALCAASSVWATYATFGEKPNWLLVLFVFFSTIYTYNIQRRLGKVKEKTTFHSHKNSLIILSCAGMLWVLFELDIYQLFVFGVLGIISIVYAFPALPIKGTKVSLRFIPYAKLWVIVLVWVCATDFLPFLDFSKGEQAQDLLLFVLQQIMFIAALTIPFDIRDLGKDDPAQRTIPMEMGIKKAHRMALLFCVGAIGFSIALYATGAISLPVTLAYFLSFILSAWVLEKGPVKSRIYYTIYIDGMILIQSGLVVLATLY